MTLPASGVLGLKDIGVELGITAGNVASLGAMSDTASKTAPDQVSDFYGYTHGSTIVVDFNNTITYTTNTASDKNAYRSLDITGRQSGDIITLTLTSAFSETAGTVLGYTYYSINSTSSWTLLRSFSSTTSPVSDSIAGVDYNDVVRIRMDVYAVKTGTGWIQTVLTGGSFTTGSGTITASGTTTWNLSVTL